MPQQLEPSSWQTAKYNTFILADDDLPSHKKNKNLWLGDESSEAGTKGWEGTTACEQLSGCHAIEHQKNIYQFLVL